MITRTMILTFVVAIAAVVSFTAKADINDQVLARYAIAESYTDEGQVYGLASVRADGVLTVNHYQYTWSSGIQGTFIGSDEITLAPAVMQRLTSMIQQLANAETERHVSEIVCMMMPMPGPSRALFVRRGYEWQTESYTGELEEVLSNSGCWDPIRITLKHQYNLASAHALMSAIEMITLQVLNQEAN